MSRNQSGPNESDQDMDVAPWRYGPAQYWYDSLGVDEAGRDFHYDFKLKSVSTTKHCNLQALCLTLLTFWVQTQIKLVQQNTDVL